MLERGSLRADGRPLVGEQFRRLAQVQNVVIEEIVSSALPGSFDYRQDHDEWVVVLDGEAQLDVDGAAVTLVSGDWVLIRAQTPHRVVRTEAGTRWLAVHIHPFAQSNVVQ
jgi:quercetin dioxygenase-like cupin family protein